MGYHCISQPGYAVEKTHSHDNHELLCFLGGDPTNINDFGAEISICQPCYNLHSPESEALPSSAPQC